MRENKKMSLPLLQQRQAQKTIYHTLMITYLSRFVKCEMEKLKR